MSDKPADPLTLKRTDWNDGTQPSDDHWSVWHRGKVVGTVVFNPEVTNDAKWTWSITAGVLPGFTLTPSNGAAVDRQSAMAAFRKRWDESNMADRLRRAGDRG